MYYPYLVIYFKKISSSYFKLAFENSIIPRACEMVVR